jgi:hypothetical protein
LASTRQIQAITQSGEPSITIATIDLDLLRRDLRG